MFNKIPCIDCITYAICKSKMLDHIMLSLNDSKDDNINNQRRLDEIIILTYYHILADKCHMINNYIKTETKLIQERHTKQYDLYSPILCIIINEAFNIQETFNNTYIQTPT